MDKVKINYEKVIQELLDNQRTAEMATELSQMDDKQIQELSHPLRVKVIYKLTDLAQMHSRNITDDPTDMGSEESKEWYKLYDGQAQHVEKDPIKRGANALEGKRIEEKEAKVEEIDRSLGNDALILIQNLKHKHADAIAAPEKLKLPILMETMQISRKLREITNTSSVDLYALAMRHLSRKMIRLIQQEVVYRKKHTLGGKDHLSNTQMFEMISDFNANIQNNPHYNSKLPNNVSNGKKNCWPVDYI